VGLGKVTQKAKDGKMNLSMILKMMVLIVMVMVMMVVVVVVVVVMLVAVRILAATYISFLGVQMRPVLKQLRLIKVLFFKALKF
jgi:hypothetical protein